MEDNALRQAEQRIWETILAAAPTCEAIELRNPWNKLAGPMQLPVGIHGQGLLSWIPDSRKGKIRSVSSSAVNGDHIQLMMIHNAAVTVPVEATLLVRSAWSRVGIPMTKAMSWPEGVIIGLDEEEEALGNESDYLCLWLQEEEGKGRLLAFKKGDYRLFDILAVAEQLRDPDFQHSYFNYLDVERKSPRYARAFPSTTPESRFLVIHRDKDTTILPRRSTRLFKDHWIFEVLNLKDPIIRQTKETSWEPSPTSQSTEPGSSQ